MRVFHRGFPNTRKLMKARGRRPSAFVVFKCPSTNYAQHDIFESLTLFPLDLSCLCIQCLVKDENDALQFKRVLDLERLHQNLVNGSHVSSRCVNSRQISGDIL